MKDIINFLGKLFINKSCPVYKMHGYLFIICLILIFAFTTSCKVRVVKLDETQAADEDEIKVYFDEGFDAAEIIDPIWETEIIPYFIEGAVDINILLDSAGKDPSGTTEKYGLASSGEIPTYNFIVKGTGNILSVNDVSKGSLNIDLAPYDNETDVFILIGPIITSTLNSIRDSYTGLVYGDVETQLQWKDIANRIKDIIKDTVLKDLDRENLAGKIITFYGAFTLGKADDYSQIIITPIKLEIE